MKKTLALFATLTMIGCSDWRFDSSDNNSRTIDSFNTNEHGHIVPAPTPSAEDIVDEVLND